MTRLFNDPASFAEDALAGFCDLHSDRVRPVEGGVVRASDTPEGKVAVVVGGGSGHYPAFCGVVGPGFADGAVVGNVFTSPSAQQAYDVARAANRGGGVLFSYGNYAGDVLNFGAAQERLRAEGVDTRTVVVTDDIASAQPGEETRRRGIAGDFVVFKVAGAAAEAGYSLDEVERVAAAANAATRTLGVAFDGCTLPGQDGQLFTVPAGKMGLGLGIHGEPGVSEVDLPTASELADTFVDGVLAETPSGAGNRVGVILNGLGRTKYEELFVVWTRVAARLRAAGLELVDPEVGELVTSLDMAGASLTLVWLDEELERLWRAPADSPAYRKGTGEVPRAPAELFAANRHADTGPGDQPRGTAVRATPESREFAGTVVEVLEAVRAAIEAAEDELGRIDAVAGDGDHGRGMVKGVTAAEPAARAAVDRGAGAASTLAEAGDAWAARAGGTSGALWGAGLRAFGAELGDDRAVDHAAVVAGARAFLERVRQLGGAAVGDKTMLDAVVPAVEALERSGGAGREAWTTAAAAATRAAEETANLVPRVGRARPLAERSVGTPDAGAVSMALIVRTVASMARTEGEGERA
ncbi:dihydroxyacetone kinase family protein [Actinoalloteichus caeruleus]|uniref:dihydroxyacetone kinase family protein n=1 Tax=Actinoalloteichus cyanogriseus TaxID=2893586 RepID=UPI0004C02B72|nr:dihydroxyacetone kinase family protein [Actinoalloteichus caeruleus]